MSIEELQQEWREVKVELKSRDELRRMMYESPAVRLRKIDQRELLRLAALLGTIAVASWVFNLFGNWSTGIFVAWSVVEVLHEFFGFRYLRLIPERASMQKSLEETLQRIKRVMLASRIFYSSLLAIALVLLIGKVQSGSIYAMLWGLILFMFFIAASWWSSRRWSSKEVEVRSLLDDLDHEAGMLFGG